MKKSNQTVSNQNSKRLHFGGLQNHCRWWLQPWNLKMLAPWKKSYDKPWQHIKNRDVTLPTKVHLVKALVFPVVMYGYEKVKVKVAQSCLTLCDPRDYPVHGILQVRILKWVEFPFSRGSSPNPGIEPRSPALQTDSLPAEPQGKLDYKESWVPKTWCFWTVVLEKSLESPLDCKEIKPVNPKGNQFWIFIQRTDVEAENPILWPPDAKNWLL